jgi:Ca2+-binding EF-hand superfamily protein
LNPTDLLAEFERIDTGLKGGTSDGFISREELGEFVSSGKAGEMSERDFNLLFDSMDIKGRGKVNFVEFCAFMSSCGKEIQELAKEEKAVGNRDEN